MQPYNYPYQQIYPYPTQMNVNPTQQNASQNVGQNVGMIQNGGFVSVPDENMVNTYPVAPGHCVTFKIEGKPIVMEKSMGFSQLESPRIERYRLVKEEVEEVREEEPKAPFMDDINDKIERLENEIDRIRGDVDALKPKKTTKRNNDGED